MDRQALGSLARSRIGRVPATVMTLVVALVLATAPIASAATLANAWSARIGTSGANGTVTINAFTTGAGSIVLKLAKLKVSTSHTVVVAKGTCSKVGTAVIKFASIKTSSSGAAARTTTLTAAQVTAIKTATKGTGKLAIRIAYGTSVKCGLFAPLGVPPYVAANITVGRSPSGIAIDPTGVWVTNWWDNTLSRINPATNTVLSVVPIDFTATQGPEAIGSGAGSLWVTAFDYDANFDPLPGVVKRINPATGATLATIPVGAEPHDIDVSPGAVWVVNADSGSVMRIDPATNQVVATIQIPDASGVTVGLGAVWVVGATGQVTRIDPATNQIVTTIPTQTTGGSIATGSGAVWVTNPGTEGQADGSLSRIDPATNQVVANTLLGSHPDGLVVSGTNVWIGMYGEPTVVRVSATTNAVLNRVAVSAKVYAIAAGTDVVWAVHNLPIPVGGTEPPAGSVSRISASAPIASATPTPTTTPPSAPPPTIVGSSDRLAELTSYRYVYGATQHGTGSPLGDYWGESYGTVVPPQTASSLLRRSAPGQTAGTGLIIIGDRTWVTTDGVTFGELTGNEEILRRYFFFLGESPWHIANGYELWAGLLTPAGTETKNGVSCLRFHAAGPNPQLIPIGVPSDWSATMDVWVAKTGGYLVSARWDVVSPAGGAVGEFRHWIDVTNVNDPTNAVAAPS